ncbi:TetR/AcrR family transcriptional regulator [Anaerocolumna sp. AGMB13025]|uniref:TetR/AcrR family transcriptional regulator n=1 Tax=Anaerocolumna sp. AGMB13025 TaxID=3039116 RepID=UPI00241D9F89|nr:TetR/AcrR family transcriptional regulator [Anaerocolumna sp. AGMB13025]WFR56584.1 TetR/AcrR family transcriptional regulator [Anaerocolumna sp. AGMB13025]
MARRRLLADEAKIIILAHARTLFIEKGYNQATMDELCELTQMSKGNLYHHFKNKEELFLQVLTQHIEQVNDKWLAIVNHDMSSTNQLLALADLYGRDCENPLIKAVEEYVKTPSSDTDALETIQKMMNLTFNTIKQVIENGIVKKEFKGSDAEALSFAVWSMLAGSAQFCMSMPNLTGDDYAAFHVKTIKLLLEGISL